MARDYRQEYARRIARGLAQGLTRSQARGHPGPGLSFVSSPSVETDRLESAVKQMRRGKSMRQSAKSVHVSPERLRSYLTQQGIGQKAGSRWTLGPDNRRFDLLIYSGGEAKPITVRGLERAELVGRYLHAVKQFLGTNDRSYLEPFVGQWVQDTANHKHVFETDPNNLYRLASGTGDDFSRIYRIQL